MVLDLFYDMHLETCLNYDFTTLEIFTGIFWENLSKELGNDFVYEMSYIPLLLFIYKHDYTDGLPSENFIHSAS